MQQRYDADFHGKREVLRQQEKARRQRWEKAKIEEIREITVRGLQPEVQRLLEAHKADCRRLKVEAEDGLAAQRRQLQQVRTHLSSCHVCLLATQLLVRF